MKALAVIPLHAGRSPRHPWHLLHGRAEGNRHHCAPSSCAISGFLCGATSNFVAR